MKKLVLGAFAIALFASLAAPTYAANYCDSQGNCTGPSANDVHSWQRTGWGWEYRAPGYQHSYYPNAPYGYSPEYPYAYNQYSYGQYGYAPYVYGSTYPSYPVQQTYATYPPPYQPYYQLAPQYSYQYQ